MDLRPFLLDEEVIERIKIVKEYANANPFTEEDIQAVANGAKETAGGNENFIVKIDLGYKVVYSIEQQPCGDCRHISVSVSGDNNWPNVVVVNSILELFDFDVRLGEPMVKIGDIWQDDETQSVNVLEII